MSPRRASTEVLRGTLVLMLVCLGLLLLSPGLARVLGLLYLLGLGLKHGMRPPKNSPILRRLSMLNNLQKMAAIGLLQYERAHSPPYSPREYRMVIQVFEKLKNQLQAKDKPRYRLIHLVHRLEWVVQRVKRAVRRRKLEKFYHNSRRRWRRATHKAQPHQSEAQPIEKPNWPFPEPSLSDQPTSSPPRPFAPYREALLKRRREKLVRQHQDRGFLDSNTLFQKEVKNVARFLEQNPLQMITVEFNAKDEDGIKLGANSKRLIEMASQLRMVLLSTGLVMPSVTFSGSSERMSPDAGLLLRETERGSFQLSESTLIPIPRRSSHQPLARFLQVGCETGEESVWPVHELSQLRQCLLYLTKFLTQHLEELVCREALLHDVEEPAFKSSQFIALAKQYLRGGRSIPRGRFLELSLQMATAETDRMRLSPESKDLPPYLSLTRNLFDFFDQRDLVYLTLSLLDTKRRARIEKRLPKELRAQLQSLQESLAEEHRGFEEYLYFLSQSPEWQKRFGPPQYLQQIGDVLVERLLASEPAPTSHQTSRALLPELACSLIRRDKDWLALALAMSYLSERATQNKVRALADQCPQRLTRILCNLQKPLPPLLLPLQKLSIFCHSLGEAGMELEVALRRYFPVLPTRTYTHAEAHRVQGEMLSRSRYWAVRGYLGEQLKLN